MAGLIAQKLDLDPMKNFTGYEADKIVVDPLKETVAGQMNALTSVNSPMMQNARTGAKQAAAKSGLLNSSMAAGAGEKAVIQTALPIAQQDAGMYSQVARDNQGAQNAASQFNSGQQNSVASQQLAQQHALQTQQQAHNNAITQSSFNTDREYQLKQAQHTFDTSMQSLRGQQQMEIDRQQQRNALLIQNNASVANLMSSSTQAIAAIQANPDIKVADKERQIANMRAMLDQQMNFLALTADIDLGLGG